MGLISEDDAGVLRDDSSVNVYVGFYIESMGNFKDSEMMFDVDMYLRMSWRDSRLAHNHSEIRLVTDATIIYAMWLPDIYFVNAREANFQNVTVPNLSMSIHRDGTVAMSRRITMKLACNMNLRRYPMDRQTCFIRIGSYAHTQAEMRVSWFSVDPVNFNRNIDLPEFAVVSMAAAYCEGVFAYAKTERDFQLAQFSCLKAEIKIQRLLTYHLVQSYIPSILIVVLSWFSFWIDGNAVPARVSLSFTTLLTHSTMGAGLRYCLPPVSYAKAIDYWFIVCMFFVFGALLEFAIVNTLMRRSQKCNLLIELGRSNGKTCTFMAQLAEFGVDESHEHDPKPFSATRATADGRKSHFAKRIINRMASTPPQFGGMAVEQSSFSGGSSVDELHNLLHMQVHECYSIYRIG